MPSSPQILDDQLSKAFEVLATGGRKVRMHVIRAWNTPGYVGWANLGGPNSIPEFGDLIRIALSVEYLGEASRYELRNNTQFWAGVMAHEVLHTLGYAHPGGYTGSFINWPAL